MVSVSDDLLRALQDPGYTPPRRAFPGMLALLAHPELGPRAERALLSAGLPAATFAAESLAQQGSNAAPIMRLIGRAVRAHEAPQLLNALIAALQSPDAEARRQAAMALGKSGRSAAEPALLACLTTDDPKLLRSVVEALGKVGTNTALMRLREESPPTSLKPVFERACLMLERNVSRSQNAPDPIALDTPLPRSWPMILECRAGLATFLAEEASGLGAKPTGPARVAFDHAGPLRPLLTLRLATQLGLVWPLRQGAAPEAVLSALLEPELVAALRSWSNGPLRFRLNWQGAGHRRADTWRVAQGLHAAGSILLNDPVQAPWTISIRQAPEPELVLTPSGAPELRFDYRVRDVPAASHPTIAATLARIGGVRPDDVVWDPFAGSGIELVERARLGPHGELHGTDLDVRALSAARENAERAGIANVRLHQADARTHRIKGLTLVLTNPPMGRRVLRARGLSGVLCQVVRNVAGQLLPGGRMVWLSPFPDTTARAAGDAGLKVERMGAVDLGGFSAELQRFGA